MVNFMDVNYISVKLFKGFPHYHVFTSLCIILTYEIFFKLHFNNFPYDGFCVPNP